MVAALHALPSMLAWLKEALRRVLSRPKSTPRPSALIEQIQAVDPAADDHQLLHLLHVSLRDGADEATELALRRLEGHYRAVDAKEKRVAILSQLAQRHPEDAAVRAELEAAHLALGHRGDAARLTAQAPRGRAEVVRVSQEAAHRVQESLQDTDPPARPAAPAIEDADTDVDLAPRSFAVPADPTAQVDKKTLDLLRRLSS